MKETADTAREWNAVATAWDAQVDEVDEHSAAATSALLERLGVHSGERVLELAAGPGSLGATWSQLVGPGGSVVVSDLAPGMIEVARRRNAQFGNVSAAVLDASAIDQPGGSFDVVVCRMGLMFTPSPAAAFAEIHRVLVPGGRVGVLTWAGMEHNPWITIVGMAAMMNGLVSGGPPIGPGSIFSLSDAGELRAFAEGAGFSDIVVDGHDVTFRAESVDAHVDRVSSLAGPLAGAFQAASREHLDAVRRTAAELASQYVSDAGVEVPGRALLLTARR